jgi:hypothetical protein
MTVTQFNTGYWYAVELKVFAKKIGERLLILEEAPGRP